MRIPYFIDNIEHKLAEGLNTLLEQRPDVAMAYFSVRGFRPQLGDGPDKGEDAKQTTEMVLDLRAFLKQPLVGAAVRELREAVKAYSNDGDVTPLIETLRTLREQQGQQAPAPEANGAGRSIRREDLHLVCYEYICS